MYCALPPVKGRSRCRYHGGKTPRGIDSPHFKHGMRVSKRILPDGFYQKTYEEVFEDPKLLTLRRDIATLEVRIAELRNDLKCGGTAPKAMKQLNETHPSMLRARKQNQPIDEHLQEMGLLLLQLQQNSETWESIATWIERKASLIEKERKHLLSTCHMMSLEQVLVLTRQMVTILHEEIQDRAVSRRINDRIRALLPQLRSEAAEARALPLPARKYAKPCRRARLERAASSTQALRPATLLKYRIPASRHH